MKNSVSAPLVLRAALLGVVTFWTGGCGSEGGGGRAADSRPTNPTWTVSRFEEHFDAVRRFSLEEDDSTVTVDPVFRPDRLGGFLVADRAENQLRRYDADGALLWRAGRGGRSLGEYGALNVAIRLDSSRVLAVDSHQRFDLWAEGGGAVLSGHHFEFSSVDDAVRLPDGHVLMGIRLTAERGPGGADLLALLDPRDWSVETTFLTPDVDGIDPQAVQTAGWASISTRGDTVAVTYSLTDTVYLVLDGQSLGAIGLPGNNLRPTRGERPDETGFGDWLERFTLVTSVHWLSDGTFVIQYQRFDHRRPRWSLLAMDRTGEFLFDIPDAPHLQFVDASGHFYFQHPASATPEDILVARLKH